MSAMRRLELHSSALSDDEYALYTTAINDITLADTPHPGHNEYGGLRISVREVRAWLRGRYSHVPSATIDTILRYFSSDFAPDDALSAGEFFAALRLVVHAQSGREIDRALAFVQGACRCLDAAVAPSTSPWHTTAHPKPSTTATTEPAVPATANPFTNLNSHNPFVAATKVGRVTTTRSEDGNPKLPPLPPRKPTAQLAPPPRHAMTSAPSLLAPQPALKKSSNPNLTTLVTPTAPPPPPPPHLKPTTHVTSTLMKQSLTASKIAQSLKKAEEQLEKERHLHVIKSTTGGFTANKSPRRSPSPHRAHHTQPSPIPLPVSSGTSASSGSDHNQSHSQPPPPLPKRRPQQPPPIPPQRKPSPPISASSFEQVALATAPLSSRHFPPPPPPLQSLDAALSRQRLNSGSNSPSPRRETFGPLPTAPPTHPDRKPPPLPHPSPTDYQRNSFDSVYNTSFASASTTALPSSLHSTPPLPSRSQSLRHPHGHTHTTSHSFSHSNTSSNSSLNSLSRTHEQDQASASPTTPTTRVFRSKSLNHPSPPPVLSAGAYPPPPHHPPPPVRRKRPESIQVFGPAGTNTVPGASHSEGAGAATLSRHSSLSSPHRLPHHRGSQSYDSSPSNSTPSSNPYASPHTSPLNLSNIQKAIAGLQPKIDARLDKARFKAEAGLSKRGFVRAGGAGEEERLMGDSRDKRSSSARHGHAYGGGMGVGERHRDDVTTVDDNDADSGFGVDLDGDGESERGRRDRVGSRGEGQGQGDARHGWNPKVGEGWQPL
ncbi:hypothetical protein AX16_007398 [Volvariella volvacea WC 439]|nr:hypothetical protein AX16_007398 [Volvariella volvacea WC 439]